MMIAGMDIADAVLKVQKKPEESDYIKAFYPNYMK